MSKSKHDYDYEVCHTPGTDPEKGEFTIRKFVHGGVFKEEYNLIVRKFKTGPQEGEWELWCSCMGFRRQKYPHIQHKHVRIVMDFLERVEKAVRENTPVLNKARYRLDPTQKPIFLRRMS